MIRSVWRILVSVV